MICCSPIVLGEGFGLTSNIHSDPDISIYFKTAPDEKPDENLRK